MYTFLSPLFLLSSFFLAIVFRFGLVLSFEEIFEQIDYQLLNALNRDLLTMQQATNFGSLISANTSISELLKVLDVLKVHENTKDVFLKYCLDQIAMVSKQLFPICYKFHCE